MRKNPTNGIQIVSLNIEQDRHLDSIKNFLAKIKAEVVLLQEVLDKDISYLESAAEMKGIFTPLNIIYGDNAKSTIGLLTLSSLPVIKEHSVYYRGNSAEIPVLKEEVPAVRMARALTITEVMKGDEIFCLLNTHFTWTPDGKPSKEQRDDLILLLDILSKVPEFVLCGDFNSPRGTPIFDTLARNYKDNIPREITSTIDKRLHKTRNLHFVVDGLFTSPQYRIEEVKVFDGLSDHCAIVAQVMKRS